MLLFVDLQINHLSTNQSYAVVGTCSDKEMLDALPKSPYSFICFCIAPQDNEESSGHYEAAMTEAYHEVKKRVNENLMETDIKGIVYVQQGTVVIHILVKRLLCVCQQTQCRS